MASSPIISWQIEGGKVETVTDFLSWAPKSLQTLTAVMKLKDGCSLEGTHVAKEPMQTSDLP